MSEWGFVTLAYGLTWGALAWYVFSLNQRRRRAEAALAEPERVK